MKRTSSNIKLKMRILTILLSTLFIFIIRGEVSHAINVKLDDRLQLVGNQNGKIIVGFKPEAEHRTQPKPFQWQQLFGLAPQASPTQTHKSSSKPEPDPTPSSDGMRVNGNNITPITGNGGPTTSGTDVSPVSEPVIKPIVTGTAALPQPVTDVSPVIGPVIEPTVAVANVMPIPGTDGIQVTEPEIQTPVQVTNRTPMAANGRPTTPLTDTSPTSGPVIKPTVAGADGLPQLVSDVSPMIRPVAQPTVHGTNVIPTPKTDVSQVIGAVIQTPVKGADRAPMTGNGRPTTPKTDKSPMIEPVISQTVPVTNVMPIPATDVSPVAGPVIQPTVQGTNVMPTPETDLPQVIEAPVIEPVIPQTVPVTNVMPIPAADVSPVAGPVIQPTVQGTNVKPMPGAVIQTSVQATDRTPNADRILMTGKDQPSFEPVLQQKQPMTPGSNVIPMPGNDRPKTVGTDVSSMNGPLIETPVRGTVLTPIMQNGQQTMSGTDEMPGIRPLIPTIVGTNSMPMIEPVIQPTIPITNETPQPVNEVPVRGPAIQPTVQGTDRTPMTGNVEPTMPGTDILSILEPVIQPTVPVTNVIPANDRPIMPETGGMTMGGLALQPQPRSRLQQLLRLQQILRLQQLQPKSEPSLQLLPGADKIQMPGPVTQTQGADRNPLTGNGRPTMPGTVELPVIAPVIQPTVPVTNLIPIPANDRPIMPETGGMTMGGLALQPQPRSRLQQLLRLQQILRLQQQLQAKPEPVIQPTIPIGNVVPPPAADISPVIGPVIQPTVPVTNVMSMTGNDGMTTNELALQPQPGSRLQQLLRLQQILRLQQLQPKPEPKLQLSPAVLLSSILKSASESNSVSQSKSNLNLQSIIQPQVPVAMQPKINDNANFGINSIQNSVSMINPLLPTVLQVLKQLSQLICYRVNRNEILSGNSALNGGLSVLCDENLWSAPAFTSQVNRVISLLQNRLPNFGASI